MHVFNRVLARVSFKPFSLDSNICAESHLPACQCDNLTHSLLRVLGRSIEFCIPNFIDINSMAWRRGQCARYGSRSPCHVCATRAVVRPLAHPPSHRPRRQDRFRVSFLCWRRITKEFLRFRARYDRVAPAGLVERRRMPYAHVLIRVPLHPRCHLKQGLSPSNCLNVTKKLRRMNGK